MSPIHPAVSLSVSHTLHGPRPEPRASCPSSHTHTHTHVLPSVSLTHTHTVLTDMVLLALLWYFSLSRSVCAVAAGHGKSSMLPLIILITSLGAASPHTYWPLPLLWNHALLTQCWWCQWAKGCMMGEKEKKRFAFPRALKTYLLVPEGVRGTKEETRT